MRLCRRLQRFPTRTLYNLRTSFYRLKLTQMIVAVLILCFSAYIQHRFAMVGFLLIATSLKTSTVRNLHSSCPNVALPADNKNTSGRFVDRYNNILSYNL